jgi:hypothetical protein
MTCSPKVDFIKFDVKTATASAFVPKLSKDTTVACSIAKKAFNGQYELQKFTLKVIAPLRSVCKLDPRIANASMKPGTSGSYMIAVSKTAGASIVDIAKQCPGDRFYMACNPKSTHFKFDEKTGKASATAPKSNTAMKTQCTFTKKSVGGESEVKTITVVFEAIPKSKCMLSVAAIPSLKAGSTGSIYTVKTVSSKPMTVPDTQKYCPGDKFSYYCDPKTTWAKYDTKTGKASIAVPKDAKNMKMTCVFMK